MAFINLATALYILLLLLYFGYHVLCLKRTQVINLSSRSRDVKLAMTKCRKYHISCLKFTPVWPIKLAKDLHDVVKEHYELQENEPKDRF